MDLELVGIVLNFSLYIVDIVLKPKISRSQRHGQLVRSRWAASRRDVEWEKMDLQLGYEKALKPQLTA